MSDILQIQGVNSKGFGIIPILSNTICGTVVGIVIKTIKINVEETLARLDAWLSKVKPCYRDEVKQAMNNFKKEHGLNK